MVSQIDNTDTDQSANSRLRPILSALPHTVEKCRGARDLACAIPPRERARETAFTVMYVRC